jgi:hypothetical protein
MMILIRRGLRREKGRLDGTLDCPIELRFLALHKGVEWRTFGTVLLQRCGEII